MTSQTTETPQDAPALAGSAAASPPEGGGRKAAVTMLVGMLIFPFLMVTMMYATYVGTMHSPQVTNLPVAVVASGDQVPGARAVASALDEIPDEQVAARTVGSTDEGRELLQQQAVAAVVVPPAAEGGTATVYVAGAGGASKAQTAQSLVLPVTTGLGWPADVQDVAPLPEGDSSGTAVLFSAMAMMLAGYVPLSIMMMGTPHLLRWRRFVPLLAAWSVVVPSVIWLVLGPVVGAVEGHYLTFLGIGSLTIAAVGSIQLFLTKLAGPVAVLIGMLFLVVFGMPASNLALPLDSMPGFFRFLHDVLPLAAAGESLRSVLYFDGVGLAPHLITLAVGLVAGLGLAYLVDRTKGDVIMAAPRFEDADTPLPALPGGPLRSKRTRYIAAAAFPGSIILMVTALMGFAMHAPTVSDMPVAVVAPTAEAAQQVTDGLDEQLGDVLDLRVVGSTAEADAAIRAQDVVAAFVLPGVEGDAATLRTASGTGVAQQTAVNAIFAQVAAAQQMPLEQIDVAPLTVDDRQGSNSMYVAMAWVMAGFLICAVLRGGAPHLRSTRQQLPILAGWAVGMSVWLWFLFSVLIGAVHGNAGALIGLGALTIFATSMATAVFTRTIGMAAVPVVVLVLMLIGVPASGGGLSLYMVPDLFRGLHDVLPLPAAVNVVRSLTYLDGTGVAGSALVIAAWGAAGLLVNVVADRWIMRRPMNPQPERHLPGPAPVVA
jgi:hypothetical protein